ncbi:unnamed protein product [Anisakis simplex]|uniref:Transthyretin-like family protein n=1 Tax=Anisakis simplex TaxID=6269 RepID=A0A0M3JX83_ANISI|nr:unnamed protein product [Anisakis simplex]
MIKSLLLLICLPVAFCALGGLIGRTQSSAAKGILKCNGKPARGVQVKLYDDDRGVDMDDLMGEATTDQNGYFEVSGSNAEMSTIDPKINIYHDCNDGWKPCQRKVTIMLPDGFVSDGARPKKIYDAGTLELAGKFPGESRDCLHRRNRRTFLRCASTNIPHRRRPRAFVIGTLIIGVEKNDLLLAYKSKTAMRTIQVILLIALIPAAMSAFGGLVGRTQSSGVRGILTCNGKPAADVLVKLYDDDRGMDFDDLMAEGKTDSHGRFEISGHIAEMTPIDPKLNIYHDCEDGWWPCQRKVSIMIPDGYITDGPRPKKFYDAGTIELSGHYKVEIVLINCELDGRKMIYAAILFVCLIPYAFGAFGGLVGRTQSAGAKGILLCNGKPAPDVLVKMYDDDRGLDFDDFMGETTTDVNGYFEFTGSNAEMSPIDPKLNIYHDCEDWWWPCQRKVSVMIPDEYITVGSRPNKLYDAGSIELAGEYSGEERDCFH